MMLMSRPYEPNPDKCCEACIFGRGSHEDWCLEGNDPYTAQVLAEITLEEMFNRE